MSMALLQMHKVGLAAKCVRDCQNIQMQPGTLTQEEELEAFITDSMTGPCKYYQTYLKPQQMTEWLSENCRHTVW